MLRRVALVRTDVSEDGIPSINRVTRIGVLGTKLATSSNRNRQPTNTRFAHLLLDITCLSTLVAFM
jgi:hypothetical protein